MANEQMIPEAALRDENAVEMLRVWIAEKRMHCSMRVGMYQKTMNIPETRAWGVILADVARHLAGALESGYSADKAETIAGIRDNFLRELARPTSKAEGGFR